MRTASSVLVTATVLLAACSQKGPAQSPPPPSAASAPQAAPSGSAGGAAPTAEKSAAPASAEPAPAGEARPAGAQPPGETPAAEKAPAAGKPAAPEPPTFREVTVPAGTVLSVRLSTSIASDTSQVEDVVRGSLTKALVASGTTAVPAGAEIVGSVLGAKPSGRVKGRASIAFRFSRLMVGSETHQIHTAQIAREAAPDRKGDVTKGAIGGGIGAVVGGVIGGGKGAVIGAAAGGTGAVLATKGKEVRLPAGTVVSTRLEDPLVVVLPATNK